MKISREILWLILRKQLWRWRPIYAWYMCTSMWTEKGMPTLLALKRSVGVTPEVNWGIHWTQAVKHESDGSNLDSKSRSVVTRSPQKGLMSSHFFKKDEWDCLTRCKYKTWLGFSPAADGVVVVVRVSVAGGVDEDPVPGAQVPLHGVLTAPPPLPPDRLQPVVQHCHRVPSLLLHENTYSVWIN